MNKLFTIDPTGIPILVLYTEDYGNWLLQQKENTSKWLTANHFEGKGQCIVPNTTGGISCIIYGISKDSDYFVAQDLALKLPPAQYALDLSNLKLDNEKSTQKFEIDFASTWALSCYRFEKYKKNNKPLPTLSINSEDNLQKASRIVDAIQLVRDQVNTPACDLMPADISKQADELAAKYGAHVNHIIGDNLLKENYPTIHAVGRASIFPPRLIDLKWGNEKAPMVTLVGKGVCFDSGGLDLKPSNGMRNMKKDMGGAAHVLGLASLIMSSGLNIRLRVLIPAVENAVSSNAFRPGDVITTRQGISVEIDNTDAEGRLVLCDALTEANSENPELILDFATLTGACRVALGTELPGFFSNSKDVAVNLIEAGEAVKDPVWQLPLHKPYQDMLKSDIADTLNSAASGLGGAITAALYLQLFISKETPWVHFDVMAWNNRKLPGRPIGGEAFGIRAVFKYLEKRYK